MRLYFGNDYFLPLMNKNIKKLILTKTTNQPKPTKKENFHENKNLLDSLLTPPHHLMLQSCPQCVFAFLIYFSCLCRRVFCLSSLLSLVFLLFAKLRVFRWLYFFNVLYYVDWVMLFLLSLPFHFPLVFNGNHFRRQYVLSWYYSNCFESRCSSYTCRFFILTLFLILFVFFGEGSCVGGE
jgi:hypothetical protein